MVGLPFKVQAKMKSQKIEIRAVTGRQVLISIAMSVTHMCSPRRISMNLYSL
jgi:hypothetical protein